MTTAQAKQVRRLQAKGWIDPWYSGGRIFLFLPFPAWMVRLPGNERLAGKRHNGRKPVRVTQSGRILAGWGVRNHGPGRNA